MAAFGTLFAGLFSVLLSVFGRFFVAEKAWRLASVATVLALIVALAASLFSCSTGMCASAISGMSSSHHNFAVGLGMVFNSTTFTAASCYMTVWLGCQMYVIKKSLLRMLVG